MRDKSVKYSVPEKIVRELCLTELRRSDGQGNYLLSQADLRPYGVEKAVAEGAKEITNEEVQNKFNPLKTFGV